MTFLLIFYLSIKIKIFYSNNIVNINYKGYDLTYEIIGITDNYDNLGKYLYIQTCNESANGNIILVAKKV